MKPIKPLFWSVVIVLLVILVVQNIDILLEKKAITLNLLLWQDKTPPIYLSVYLLAFFFTGLLVSFLSGLSERVRAKNEIKNHRKTIRKLEEEIQVLKSLPVEKEDTPSEMAELTEVTEQV
ncbi:MAG: hypothetical protein BA872_07470 [Desulfobacterales bacterium C00003060]|nr:MAG: hypothetical protein BA861_12875 [Desulfobacterales bacterium S3730MH5]OEU79650.1 MAG: hypothetical protein BA872_07470 [Desulfobacterales bacterium C00003060]OEU83128.1 MAG: hypothetical protein BA865_08150 [Desulfobacterales bacterium S5133MH4]